LQVARPACDVLPRDSGVFWRERSGLAIIAGGSSVSGLLAVAASRRDLGCTNFNRTIFSSCLSSSCRVAVLVLTRRGDRDPLPTGSRITQSGDSIGRCDLALAASSPSAVGLPIGDLETAAYRS